MTRRSTETGTETGTDVPTVFTTERLTARAWGPEDAATIFDIYGRWEVARWLGATPSALESLDEAEELGRRWAERGAPEATYGIWCITLTGSATPIGTVLLVPIPGAERGEVEVGWHLHPDHWGNGYATEAARAAIARGLSAGLDEVLAVVSPDNDASLAMCRRLGLHARGRSEAYYGRPLEVFSTRPHTAH
ncbi:GNAT family N-acetyltransferase [Terrabacter sp. NPDC080008]|uniref:GNAT family N-acetyltransferase n=1 Tax=Terrabacter sp. NPDC080008 TaxID=3155176 RepID=UPI003450C49F